MRLLFLLSLLLALAVALEFPNRETRQRKGRQHKKTSRPKRASGVSSSSFRTPRRPSNAPSQYRISLDKPSRRRSKSALKRLPADMIDPDSGSTASRGSEAFGTAQRLRRQDTANDFYECTAANPAPSDADCSVIIDQVYGSNDDVAVAAGSCLVFAYQTCQGFFCSLCETLTTTTDFVGNQLATAEALCVAAGGQDGTVVGEDAPQWDAGFVYAGEGLPTYDVC
ncbi:hypothetical protein NKR23_g6694 [Pleurostoma richardsiae]|uniref:Uncharacterized protein n=1 Tax=Pleurostoma richardsiae TaxID=41990 RepID=A0AA38RP56_9PEZI|nr:hypothetical protein NKR23_g6694 [Pleurostoma richardsiae]